MQDLSQSKNIVKVWHQVANNRVLIKRPSITRLAKCILREQARFEIDIERLRTSEQSKKKKKVYQNLDARLKRIVFSHDVNNIEKYFKLELQ